MRETRRSIEVFRAAARASVAAATTTMQYSLFSLPLLLSLPCFDRELLSGHAHGLGRRGGRPWSSFRGCEGEKKCVSKRASRLLNSFFVDAQQRKKSVDEGESWKKTRIHFLSIFSSSQRFVAVPILHPQHSSLSLARAARALCLSNHLSKRQALSGRQYLKKTRPDLERKKKKDDGSRTFDKKRGKNAIVYRLGSNMDFQTSTHKRKWLFTPEALVRREE